MSEAGIAADEIPANDGEGEILNGIQRTLEKGLTLDRSAAQEICSACVFIPEDPEELEIARKLFPIIRMYPGKVIDRNDFLASHFLMVEIIELAVAVGETESAREIFIASTDFGWIEDDIKRGTSIMIIGRMLGRFAHHEWARDIVEDKIKMVFMVTDRPDTWYSSSFIQQFLMSAANNIRDEKVGETLIPIMMKVLEFMGPEDRSSALGVLAGAIQQARGANWYRPTMDSLMSRIEKLSGMDLFVALRFAVDSLVSSTDDEEKKQVADWITRLAGGLEVNMREKILSRLGASGTVN